MMGEIQEPGIYILVTSFFTGAYIIPILISVNFETKYNIHNIQKRL